MGGGGHNNTKSVSKGHSVQRVENHWYKLPFDKEHLTPSLGTPEFWVEGPCQVWGVTAIFHKFLF